MSHLSPLNRSAGNSINPDVANPARANISSRVRITHFNSNNTEIPVTIGALVGQKYLHRRKVAVQTMLNQHVPLGVSYTQLVTINDLLSNGAILIDSANNIWMQPHVVLNNQGREVKETITIADGSKKEVTPYDATMYFAGLSLKENFKEAVDLQATKIEAYRVALQSFGHFFKNAFDINIKADALLSNNFVAVPAPAGANQYPHDKQFYALPISVEDQTKCCYWIEGYSPRQMLNWWRENPGVRDAGALLPPRFPFQLNFEYGIPNGNIALIPNMQFNTPTNSGVRFTEQELRLAGMQPDPLNLSAYFAEERFANNAILRHQWYPHFNLHENNLAAAEFGADSGLPVADSTQTLSFIKTELNKQQQPVGRLSSTGSSVSSGFNLDTNQYRPTASASHPEAVQRKKSWVSGYIQEPVITKSVFVPLHVEEENDGDLIDIDIVPKESMPRPRSVSPALAPDLSESWERQRQGGLTTDGAKTFFLDESEFIEIGSDEKSNFVSPSPLQFNDSDRETGERNPNHQAALRRRQGKIGVHEPILQQRFSDESVAANSIRIKSSVARPIPLHTSLLPQQEVKHSSPVIRVVHGSARPSGRPTRPLLPSKALEPQYTRFANTFASTVPIFTTAKSETVTHITPPKNASIQQASSFIGTRTPSASFAKTRAPSLKAAPAVPAFQRAIFTKPSASTTVTGQHTSGFEALLGESRAKVEARSKVGMGTSQTPEELFKYFNLPNASSSQIRAGAIPRRTVVTQPNAPTTRQPIAGTSTQNMLRAILREQRWKQQQLLSKNLLANPAPNLPLRAQETRVLSSKQPALLDNTASVSVGRRYQQPQPIVSASVPLPPQQQSQKRPQWTQLKWQQGQLHPQERQVAYFQGINSKNVPLSEQPQHQFSRNNSQNRNNRR